jgi:predicted phosphate transport protein (TIGR00153 family)
MFSSLMPQRKEFFDLLTAHTDRVVAAANAALRLVNSLGTNSGELDQLVKEVAMNEGSGDKIKADMITLLHKSFITPFSRDEIHTLTLEIDKILGALQDVANAVGMYHIKDSTPESRELAALAADACLRLNRAVISLADKERTKDAINLCHEIDAIESKADKVLKKAVTRLFADDSQMWNAIRMREFYFLQEHVLDYCQEAARTVEEILIENS